MCDPLVGYEVNYVSCDEHIFKIIKFFKKFLGLQSFCFDYTSILIIEMKTSDESRGFRGCFILVED